MLFIQVVGAASCDVSTFLVLSIDFSTGKGGNQEET